MPEEKGGPEPVTGATTPPEDLEADAAAPKEAGADAVAPPAALEAAAASSAETGESADEAQRWRVEARKAFAARDAAKKRARELEEEKTRLESALADEKTRCESELAVEKAHAEELAAKMKRAEELAAAIERALEARMERIRPDRRSLVPEDLPPEVRLAYIDRHEEILFPRPKSPPQGGAKPAGGEVGTPFRGMGAQERAELRRSEPETYRRLADAEQERLRRERQAEKSA